MLGNSSSALVEAPAVGLPAVNVGGRQAGRDRDENVLDATADGTAVAEALRHALTPGFHETARTARPTLADGRAGARIADIIAAWHPPSPPTKPPIRLEP
jgi:UDP-N-acetylglucosamine 2-epimerase